MPNIYATNDGASQLVNNTSWVSARSATEGNASTFSNNEILGNLSVGQRIMKTAGRGSMAWVIARSFFTFDTSGISVAPSSATLKIYGFSSGTTDVIALKSDYMFHNGEATTIPGNLDYDSIANAETPLGNSDGSGAGTFASTSVVEYSSELSSWSTSGYNDITLNSDALSDMASLSTFKVAVINYDYDYLDIEPATNTNERNGMYISYQSGTDKDPYIDYTAGTTTVAHNANFFGSNF